MPKTASKSSSSGKGGDFRVSKIEAVRRAVRKLGGDAQAADIQRYVKKEFDVEMDLEKVYTYRWMANKEAAANSGVTKAAGTSGLMAKKAAPVNAHDISKMEAVNRALSKLGSGAKPTEIKQFVHSKFKIEVELGTISTYKSTILKEAAGQSSITRRPAESSVAHRPAPAELSSPGLSTRDMRTMKELLDRIGAEDTREMIDILAT